MQFALQAFVYLLYATVLVIVVTGAIRGLRERPQWTVFTRSTRIGFGLGMASALVALNGRIWSGLPASFSIDDGTLRKLYAYGTLLSVLAVIASLIGVWKRSAIRWHALILSLSMLLLWLMWVSGE